MDFQQKKSYFYDSKLSISLSINHDWVSGLRFNPLWACEKYPSIRERENKNKNKTDAWELLIGMSSMILYERTRVSYINLCSSLALYSSYPFSFFFDKSSNPFSPHLNMLFHFFELESFLFLACAPAQPPVFTEHGRTILSDSQSSFSL